MWKKRVWAKSPFYWIWERWKKAHDARIHYCTILSAEKWGRWHPSNRWNSQLFVRSGYWLWALAIGGLSVSCLVYSMNVHFRQVDLDRWIRGNGRQRVIWNWKPKPFHIFVVHSDWSVRLVFWICIWDFDELSGYRLYTHIRASRWGSLREGDLWIANSYLKRIAAESPCIRLLELPCERGLDEMLIALLAGRKV